MQIDYETIYSTNSAMEKGLPNNGDGNRNAYDCAIAIGALNKDFRIGVMEGDDFAFGRFDIEEAIQIRDALAAHIARVQS